jgi:hypothetical protein
MILSKGEIKMSKAKRRPKWLVGTATEKETIFEV